jgi:hypothetical protein
VISFAFRGAARIRGIFGVFLVFGTDVVDETFVESSSGRRGVSTKRTVFARFAFRRCEAKPVLFDVSIEMPSNPLPSFHPDDFVAFGVIVGNLK